MRAVLALSLVLVGGLLSVPARADEPSAAQSRRAVAIERETMSPFCPGMTLYTCPSPNASRWRSDIREMLDEGLDETEIRARLQARAPGFDLSGQPAGGRSWTLPALAGALATLLLALVAWRLRRGRAPGAREAAGDEGSEREDDPRLDARLEDELAALEEL